MGKEIYIKIYDTSGNITKLAHDFIFSDFTESINGGVGGLTVKLPYQFDDFGLGTEIDKDYEIKIVAYDKEGENIIYSGRIDTIRSSVSDKESVELYCSGYVAELAQNLHEDATKIKFSYPSQELTDILKDVLDKHNTSLSTARVDYNGTSITTTSKNISIKFYASTVLDAINNIVNKADPGWFFRVGVDNVFYFSQVSSTPDHYFVFGKDIERLEVEDSNRSKITKYLFYNGQTENDTDYIMKLYTDGTTDRRFEIDREDRVTQEATADEKANRIIETFKNGIATVYATIIDSNLGGGYDIESINVGDTCKFLNVGSGVSLPTNGIITSKVYNKDYANIVIEDTQSFVSRELLSQHTRQQLADFNAEIPANYTT